jgi:hypothetical protein
MHLTVRGTKIRQDVVGRYCLNDLHKASGGNEKHAPNRWLRYDHAKRLIEAFKRRYFAAYLGGEVETEVEPVSVVPGRHRTTFAVLQLMLSYAMWISEDFHLDVVDNYITNVVEPIIENENYWFGRYDHLEKVRPLVLEGKPYKEIEAALEYKPGRVGRAVRSMCKHGLLSPVEVAEVQKGPAKAAALKMAEGYGKKKPKEEKPKHYPLFDGFGEGETA